MDIAGAIAWLQALMTRIMPVMNLFVIFLVILFLGFLAGKTVGRLSRRLLGDLKVDAAMRKHLNTRFSLERGLSTLLAMILYIGSVVLALNAIGFTQAVIMTALFILAAALLLSVFFLLKDLLPNVTGGLALRREISPGNYIRIPSAEGTVQHIGVTKTVLLTRSNDTLFIPNKLFSRSELRVLRRKPGGVA